MTDSQLYLPHDTTNGESEEKNYKQKNDYAGRFVLYLFRIFVSYST